MSASVAIFEPIYAADQTLSCAEFMPLHRTDNARPEWREFKILIDMYRNGDHLRHDFTGLFSPKFSLKANMPGATFIEFVEQNRHRDVVFVNPFPQIAYWSYNVWMQGEQAHPGLTDAAQALLDASGVPISIRDTPRHGPDLLAYCNFWVGSRRFWDDYVGGALLPIAEFLEANPTHPAAIGVMCDTLHTDPAPFLPFIIERLFSTFVSMRPRRTHASYQFSADAIRRYCINDFERLLFNRMQEKIDYADSNGTFSLDLIEQMETVCALWQKHFFDFYSTRPHPHTGQIVRV